MNISQFIAKKFSEKGLCDVFSIVGGHSLYLNYAFSESNDLNVTYFHHEQSASMAADAYYRLKLKPAIVNVSLSKSISIVPLSVVTSKSSAVICAST